MILPVPIDIEAGLKRPKIDVHAHVRAVPNDWQRNDWLVTCARRVGITELWCSRPIAVRIAPMEEVRAHNDRVIDAMRQHPDIIRALCYVIPSYYDEAIAEIERCLDAGMIGIKLYNQYKVSDPVVRPVIEYAVSRGIPILCHAGYLSSPERERQPLTSHGADFAAVSERYPDAVFINGHIGGGGDWEWTIKALRDASPNVYVDTSGSNLDDGQIEFAVEQLGIDRVLFATDNMIEGGVGKVLGALLTEEELEKVCYANAARILQRAGLRPLAEQIESSANSRDRMPGQETGSQATVQEGRGA